jgi:hypothetical protein
MKKENLKQNLINRITDYVMGAIDNDFVEEEMIDVKEGVYIAPAADEEKPWYEQGCEVTWKDADGNAVKNVVWTLDAFAYDFGDLVVNGRESIETIAEELYDAIFED